MTRAEFCAFARAHDNFVILTHRRPDGDTIGSAGALCLGLRQLGKTAFVLTNEQFTPRFDPFLDGLVCEALPAGATVISADIASEGLLSFDAVRMGLTPVCAVDHHGSNSLACPKLVEADKAACGEIIHAILLELGVTVTKRIAECLYVAISTDTGCFKFSNTTSNTHRTAAALIEAGADVYPINKLFFDTKSFSRLRMEAKLTETMEFYADGTVGVCVMPKRLLAEFSATEDDLDSISGFARSIEGVRQQNIAPEGRACQRIVLPEAAGRPKEIFRRSKAQHGGMKVPHIPRRTSLTTRISEAPYGAEGERDHHAAPDQVGEDIPIGAVKHHQRHTDQRRQPYHPAAEGTFVRARERCLQNAQEDHAGHPAEFRHIKHTRRRAKQQQIQRPVKHAQREAAVEAEQQKILLRSAFPIRKAGKARPGERDQ